MAFRVSLADKSASNSELGKGRQCTSVGRASKACSMRRPAKPKPELIEVAARLSASRKTWRSGRTSLIWERI
jgi:hypothetical protein